MITLFFHSSISSSCFKFKMTTCCCLSSKPSMAQCLLILELISFGVLVCVSSAEFIRLQHPVKDDGPLRILVVGDWGREGMGRIGEKLDIDFVVSTGDNFYDNGLTGINDPAFEDSFSNIYTAESLQKPWYNVLGNHDYRGDIEAQLSDLLRKVDSRWVCLRSFLLDTEIAEFYFVDTTPLVDDYFNNPKDHKYDWSGVLPRDNYIAQVLGDLESALRESTSKWKIVVGHHTIRSIGHHGDTAEIGKLFLPILEAYNVDFYINGHDHCLEHINSTSSPLQFLTSGAGSKAWRGDVKSFNSDDGVNFFYDGQGFMSLQLTRNNAKIEFYNIFGNVLHSWNVFKQLHLTV